VKTSHRGGWLRIRRQSATRGDEAVELSAKPAKSLQIGARLARAGSALVLVGAAMAQAARKAVMMKNFI